MSALVVELAEEIKEKGRRSILELPPLLEKAEQLAVDDTQDPLTRALAHRAAANALQLLNRFEPSLRHYDEAISILENLKEPAELGRTLHAKVGLLVLMSRFDEVLKCSDRARKLFEELGDRHRIARLDLNLSRVYHRLGRFYDVLECSQRALKVLEEVGDREGLFVAYTNSGLVFMVMHDFPRAEHHYRCALELATELNITSWIRQSRHNLAVLSYRNGNTDAALSEIIRLRAEYQADEEDDWVGMTWLDEAEILLEIGDVEESIRAAERAESIVRRLGLNFEIGKALLFQAIGLLRLGRGTNAMPLLEKAVARFSTERNGVWSAVATLQAALLRGEAGEATALVEATTARQFLRKSGLTHRIALADIVIGRIQRANGESKCAIDSFRSAVSLAEECGSRWMQFHAYYELGQSLPAQNNVESAELFQKAEGMLNSLWNCLGSDELKMAFLSDRQNVYTHLVRSSFEKSPNAAYQLSEKARSRVLRERLASGEPLKLHDDETIVEYFISGDDLFIFAEDADRLYSACRNGVVQSLKETWTNLERHLASCSVKWEHLRSVHHVLAATAQKHLHDLYQVLIAPVEKALRKSIVFVPHGFLHGVPFHALHNGADYLIEKYMISYSPSAALYRTPARVSEFAEPLLIAFSRDSCVSSVAEIENAADRLPDAQVLVNPSKTALSAAFETPRRLVHIAGHAGIDTVSGKLSWIETTEGKLTSTDLTEMQIRAKTLIITGCQSARRLIQPGDEWLGLMRAFYLSGASTIVSALWDIRDEAARRFASSFYNNFDGRNAAVAVHDAVGSLREWRSHPYFWGGFGIFSRKET